MAKYVRHFDAHILGLSGSEKEIENAARHWLALPFTHDSGLIPWVHYNVTKYRYPVLEEIYRGDVES